MARCLPFPPPGYTRNGACGEALIESIKLQREILESKKVRKIEKKELRKEKNEKKEKRREEKEKKKVKRQTEGISKYASGGKGKDLQYYRPEKSREESVSGCLQKIDDEENEHLERSGITEEHDQPLSPPEMSECNQGCNKRKRSSSPSSHDQRTGSGTVIRIRLPLKRHNQPRELHHDDQLVSTSGTGETADCITHVINGSKLQLSNSDSLHLKELQSSSQQGACNATNLDKELPTSSQQGACNASRLDKDKRIKRKASSYSSLFRNWVPLPFKFEEIEDDQDWLFKSKPPEDRLDSKRAKIVKSVDVSQSSTPVMWPSRAHWLPEAEIYALPYTVPI